MVESPSTGAPLLLSGNTGTSEQIATATSLVPVDIEISHRTAVLSLPVLELTLTLDVA